MHRAPARLAALAVPLLTPVAGWWLIGDLSEPGPPQYLDRMFTPPDLPGPFGRTAGIAALVGIVAALVTVGIAARQRVIGRAELRATVPLVLAAIYVAYGARVLTAAVGGANIGGGMILFGAPTILLPLLAAGAFRWWELR